MQLQIFDKWQKLVFSDYKDNGHLSDADKKRKKAYKILRKDELFFGLGEKTGSLNRRGREYKMWNSDKPCYSTTEDPLYKSIPFFLSNYQYGIFLDNTYKTEFKFGTESDDYYSFEAPDGEFIYYFIFGKDYKEILSQYITLTGKPIMPPNWAFGFSQSRGLYTSEKQAIEIASEFRKRQIPCDVIYQDIGWTQHLQNFEWRQGNYHNPREMVSKLKDKGFKMILSQDPVISKANNNQWTEADSLGFLVKDVRSGKSYDMPWPWGGNCGVVDFTNPEVANWWGKYQQKPLDDGVKGFWTDMGEPAWSNEEDVDRLNMKHHAGIHDEIHNVFGDSFRGATWVSIHNGGGVGWGEVINGGFGMLLDGSEDADRRLKSMLFWDVNNGISRRSWARNEGAIFAIKRAMEAEPNLKVTLPNFVDESLF
jgi:alpha-glucosidase